VSGRITGLSVTVSVAGIAIVTGSNLRRDLGMDEATIDRDAMGRLAKALAFVCGTDHPTTVAMKAAAESGTERDIKNARALFLKLKQSDRRAALAMLDG
jgi:Ribonuclease G/E